MLTDVMTDLDKSDQRKFRWQLEKRLWGKITRKKSERRAIDWILDLLMYGEWVEIGNDKAPSRPLFERSARLTGNVGAKS